MQDFIIICLVVPSISFIYVYGSLFLMEKYYEFIGVL